VLLRYAFGDTDVRMAIALRGLPASVGMAQALGRLLVGIAAGLGKIGAAASKLATMAVTVK
jgi:hypothetical protein